MDIQSPAYCTPEVKEPETEKGYTLYVAEKPHATWTGFACWGWTHEKKIEGSIWYTFDTTEQPTVDELSTQECWEMVKTRQCFGNSMKQDNNMSYYNQRPQGEGSWWSTVTYKTRQCQLQAITLTKDCPSCPIISPIGQLTADVRLTTQLIHQIRVVWQTPKIFDGRDCALESRLTGAGFIHSESAQTIKLTDEDNQLDYIYYKEKTKFPNCNMKEVNQLVNIPNAYLLITDEPLRKGYMVNTLTTNCLQHNDNFLPSANRCTYDDPRQMFTLTKQNVLYHGNKTFFAAAGIGIVADKYGNETKGVPLKFMKKQKLEILAYCIQNKPNTTEITGSSCDDDGTSWHFKPLFNDSIKKVQGNNNLLLMQHHQFIEDQEIERENAINQEKQNKLI